MATFRPADWVLTAEHGPPARLIEHLWPHARIVRARRGQIVIAHGSVSDEVYFVLSGAFEVSITARDGQDVVVRDLGPGALFGELAALNREPRSASVTATADSSLARVSAESFLEAVSQVPEASRWFMERLGGEVRRLTDKIFELSALAARDRLHCELLRLASRAPRVGSLARLEPAPTHEALAQRIGSQREVVTRELARLEEKDIVCRRRRQIDVDLLKLARIVEAELGYPVFADMGGGEELQSPSPPQVA